MKIYYAHHTWKYDTKMEAYEKNVIYDAFPDSSIEIVNPSEVLPQDCAESEIMTAAIDTLAECDTLVFSTVSGMIGRGVFDELMYALNTGMTVYQLDGNKCYHIKSKNCIKEIIFDGDNRVYALVNSPLF